MRHVVSYSGGLGSFAAAKRVVDWYGARNTVLMFADTLIEDKDLYRFIRETVSYLGVGFRRLIDGRTPWEVFRDVRYEGNSRVAPCSRILKTELCRKWMDTYHPPAECQLHLGIDWMESHRLERAQKNWAPYTVRAPLCEEPIVAKDGTLSLLERIGVAPPRLYGYGFAHNNCGGFCVRAGQAHFATLKKSFPRRYRWHEQQQEALHSAVPGARPFLRKTVSGKLEYWTLRKFREHLDADPDDFDKYSYGGCGCFADE